jgi:hypothetical protein
MNLNELPTPRTDEFERAICDGLESALEFARAIEREAAAWRAVAQLFESSNWIKAQKAFDALKSEVKGKL